MGVRKTRAPPQRISEVNRGNSWHARAIAKRQACLLGVVSAKEQVLLLTISKASHVPFSKRPLVCTWPKVFMLMPSSVVGVGKRGTKITYFH